MRSLFLVLDVMSQSLLWTFLVMALFYGLTRLMVRVFPRRDDE